MKTKFKTLDELLDSDVVFSTAVANSKNRAVPPTPAESALNAAIRADLLNGPGPLEDALVEALTLAF
jgi:hypothetical protein